MDKWRQELDVDNWVMGRMLNLGVPFHQQRAMSPYLVEALKGSSKTASKQGAGIPDLSVEAWVDDRSRKSIPVLIEDKLGLRKLSAESGGFLKQDDKSISNFALNGALYYARSAIGSGLYEEVIAIGIAGDDEHDVTMQVLYVFGNGERSYKTIENLNTFDFLESQRAFNEFLQAARLSDAERYRILVRSRGELQSHAKKLNRLMHDLNVTAAQRVLYVSGMLLAMQDIEDGAEYDPGLIPSDLRGSRLNGSRDGQLVVQRISNYLDDKGLPESKKRLMIASFAEISKDDDRDVPHAFEMERPKELGKLLPGKSSVTKRIFTFIYEFVYRAIDGTAGHLDIMGEMYSEFLKYALGDGKEIGIVLTPPYVTKMMAEILEIDDQSRVMDLAAGSAGFLISSMEVMIQGARRRYGVGTRAAEDAEERIKSDQLFGAELNAEMYALATTNMILRGDGSSRIEKADTFKLSPELLSGFKADRLLLNPPFSYRENGMPFLDFGMRHLELGGRAAIIIQDSAGSGRAPLSTKRVLANSQLVASIKMPGDLFQPMAGVQTSIYVLERTGRPHDVEKPVRFIDFRNDGYKRSRRALYEVDNPLARYSDVVRLVKAGLAAKVEADWGDLAQVVVDAPIALLGNDWNFDAHQTIDAAPTFDDFRKTIGDYLSWEVGKVMAGDDHPKDEGASILARIEALSEEYGVLFAEFRVGGEGGLFDIKPTVPLGQAASGETKVPVVSNTAVSNGVSSYRALIPNNPANVITFSDTTDSMLTVFYQPEPFVGFPHVQAMLPLFEGFNRRRAMYFISAFRKAIGVNYTYSQKFNRDRARAIEVVLPTSDGVSPAWEFMEHCVEIYESDLVQEIEAERDRTIEAYLAAAVLDDPSLCDEEAAGIEMLLNGDLDWCSFKLVGPGGLFEYSRGMRQTIQNRRAGATALITAGAEDQGIAGYVDSGASVLFAPNTITIDMFSNVFYRNFDYYADDNILSLVRTGCDPQEMLFLAASMQRLQKRGYDKQFRVGTLLTSEIRVPVSSDGNPDWDLMRTVVVAAQKTLVAEVLASFNARIEAARELLTLWETGRRT